MCIYMSISELNSELNISLDIFWIFFFVFCFSLNADILFYYSPVCLFLFSFLLNFTTFIWMSANRYINKLCYAFRAISASLQTMLFCWVWLLTLQNKHTKNNTKTKTGVRCPVKATNIICKLSRSIKM